MKTVVPQQSEGNFSDTVSTVELKTVEEAILHFEKVKNRFFTINSWQKLAGEEKAEFALCDHDGNEIENRPQVNDYLRIKLPGIHNPTGDSFDWVRVEILSGDTSENSEIIGMKVRPSENPQKKDGKTAHFFNSDATCSFIINRNGNRVTAEVHGRNEIPNTEDLSALEKVRNSVTSFGAMVAGSKFQWKSLTDGLVQEDEK